jgi:acylphosphatase
VTVRAEDVGRGVFTTRETTTMIRRRVTVRGHVQGVFFRETTRRRALAEGITGWVHNQPDGSVEAVLEGERDAVERLVAYLREGPRGARVDWVDVASEEPEGLSGFETR